LEEYTNLYYPSIFAAISRLTRLPEHRDLDMLTHNVLADLWHHKEVFEAESRKGVFIYKTILYHVFSYLKQQGDEKRIAYLQKILPINPDLYIT
jgi:hypothetical protein